MTLLSFGGVRVVQSELAVTYKVDHRVERVPIPKRRRRWRVVRTEHRTPGAYFLQGRGILYVHPKILEKLRDSVDASVRDLAFFGTAISRGGERIDPRTIYEDAST